LQLREITVILTSLARLNEEHFWFSTQRRTVCTIKQRSDVIKQNETGITVNISIVSIDATLLPMGKDNQHKCVIGGMVSGANFF